VEQLERLRPLRMQRVRQHPVLRLLLVRRLRLCELTLRRSTRPTRPRNRTRTPATPPCLLLGCLSSVLTLAVGAVLPFPRLPAPTLGGTTLPLDLRSLATTRCHRRGLDQVICAPFRRPYSLRISLVAVLLQSSQMDIFVPIAGAPRRLWLRLTLPLTLQPAIVRAGGRHILSQLLHEASSHLLRRNLPTVKHVDILVLLSIGLVCCLSSPNPFACHHLYAFFRRCTRQLDRCYRRVPLDLPVRPREGCQKVDRME